MGPDKLNSVPMWLNLGREYFDAVEAVNSNKNFGERAPLRPMFQLAGIGLEVVFKAELLRTGVTKAELKREYGHDIKKLLEAMDKGALEQCESSARSVFIRQITGFRDSHKESFGRYSQAVDALGELPTNEDIGKNVPNIRGIVEALHLTYAKTDILRYAQVSWVQTNQLKFPPYINIPALYVCAFGRAFANHVGLTLRDTLRTRTC